MKPTFLRSLILTTAVLCSLSGTAEAKRRKSFFWTPPPTTTTTTTTTYSSGSGGGGSTPAIPEPASMVLMGVGTAAMLYVRQRRRRGNVEETPAEEA